jgi:superkiller protein 3
MSAKAALKAAKTALDQQQYDTVIEQAQNVLSTDPHNYFALLFLGRAYEKQNKYDDAAKVYKSATSSKPEDTQSWLGLCSVYEAQGPKRVDEYREATVGVAQLFVASGDPERCQVVINKLFAFTKQHGTKAQNKQTLRLHLPGSPVYDCLEGRIPHPSHTFTRLVEITEDEEAQFIAKEISERRTRIGAKVGQVTSEVKLQVFRNSEVEELYQQIINWSSDDDVRRQYEEKLLQRAYEMLVVLPVEQKSSKLDQVLTLSEGMVIIHHPFRLAWDLVLESRDMDELRDLDVGILREYVTFFPDSGLARVFKAWLTSEISPFPAPPKTDDEEDDIFKPISPEERLLLLTEGLAVAPQSPLAHRLVGDYYLHIEEHQSAMDTSRSGIKAVTVEAGKLGMSFQNTKDALNSVLATALVHHQAPRNHPEAKRLFEDILQRKPIFTPALIGLGLIMEENEDYQDAIEFFTRALEQDKGNVRVGTELAWCRALSGDYARATTELEDFLQLIKSDDPRTRDLRAQTLYRIGICLWETDTSKTARRDRNGAYGRFLAAIKTNVNFAPAYTSLGTYYADYAKDKKRGRQCFQKAFELSPAEVHAAERLARFFADQGDWDIVEVIAQRVVSSGRTRPPPGSKKKGISWPHAALGVVQMNKQEYQLAIVSFLAALRISPDDYQPYVGLGESYHNSGRYNSALRTFNYALEPHDGVDMKVTGERWFAKYMLANVYRELGQYEEASIGLQAVLDERPTEFGVLMSLLQNHVEHAWRCVEMGLFGQAVENAKQAIATADKISGDSPNAFNMWKAVGDACSIFSWAQVSVPDFPLDTMQKLLNMSADTKTYEPLADVDKISPSLLENADRALSLSKPLIASLLAFKRAIHSCSHDIHAQAVAWYNLGWAEQRAQAGSDPKNGKKHSSAAVRCFKRAIELEAGNAEFWNALGIVTTTLNPKVSQHSFVRSLHLNELNAKVWANLGVLYLLQSDAELAHQAFARAQSTDPDYAHAWVGEGLIALLTGDAKESLNHFTHAFEISDSASVIVKRQYAVSSFDYLISVPSASDDLTKLIQPLFALEQLGAQSPHDLPYRHLAALFLERVGNYDEAIETLTKLCSSAEADYEAAESLAALARYALAKSDLARNQLAALRFADAAENAETALDLSSDAEESGLDAEARRKLRLSAHLTAGLAQFKIGKMQDSIGMFRAALQESSNDPDVVCSLVQVLWAQGGSEEKSVAREQLFDCVEKSPEHVGAVTLLGAIAALDADQDTIDAVRDDLLSLRTKDGMNASEVNGIETLLSSLAALSPGADADVEATMLAEAQTAILLRPDDPQAWSQLGELSEDARAAEMAIKTASKAVPPLGSMESEELAAAFAGVGTVGDAQRAAFMAPWVGDGWKSMGETLSG